MGSASRVCSACGTVNRAEYTHCFACGQPLFTPGSNTMYTPSPRFSTPPRKLLKQRYRSIYVVGKGGMGTVYIGKDTLLGNRLVAIKEMSQDGLSAFERIEAARLFKHEAHLLASLQHPNLPSIYDHFEEDQRWYLVMSFIKGQTLAEYLDSKKGTLPVREVLAIGITLCDVLNYLHTHQPPIIFRDLKPSNIMRTEDGHIYLIDFGIARFFKPGQTRDTINGGTFGYASPEQHGSVQTTPRSDIYSFGATLYQMLSGSEPTTLTAILARLQSQIPPIPKPLVILISQMLDIDENKRPASAEMVKAELQRISTGLNRVPSFSASRSPGRWLFPSLVVTGIGIILVALYFILINSTVFNANTPNGVVTTFCGAMNSQPPDFQKAYNQLSRKYQHQHSLIDFQEYFQGTSECIVASALDEKNQAGLNLTMFCPHRPPPGAPFPPPPLADGRPPSPPPVNNPVDIVLVKDGGNGWKIDTIYVVNYVCILPPKAAPSYQPTSNSANVERREQERYKVLAS